MSNGCESAKAKNPGEISAEDVHNKLGELRGLAANLLAQQSQINEKLINDPDPPKATDKAERVTNPRHFPAFYDQIQEISSVLYLIQHKQEILLKHI